MSQYNYRTILYTETDNVAGLDVTQNNLDVANYENNYQTNSIKTSSITIAETTFQIDLSYTNFKAKIVSPITWTDVKEISSGDRYELNLVTSEPI